MSGADHDADLTIMDNMIEAVRDLHFPDEYYQVDCAECGDRASLWPCSTATIVYSPSEIAVILDAVVVSRKAKAAAREVRREARQVEIANGSPLTINETLMEIYAPIIAAQLSAPLLSKWAPNE